MGEPPDLVSERIPRKTQSVRSVDKALSILEVLGASKAGLTIPELVQRTQIPKSSVHCILLTFARNGYLRRTERAGRYVFDTAFLKLAMSAPLSPRLRTIAAPYLRELMGKSHLTVHLAALEDHEALIIAKCQPVNVYSLPTRVGQPVVLHATSLGKAFISAMPPESAAHLMSSAPWSRFNENTIVSLQRFQNEMELSARRGFTIADEEGELGLRCVGVPVVTANGAVVAAISVSGTTRELSRDRFSQLGDLLHHTALTLLRNLSFTRANCRKKLLSAAGQNAQPQRRRYHSDDN